MSHYKAWFSNIDGPFYSTILEAFNYSEAEQICEEIAGELDFYERYPGDIFWQVEELYTNQEDYWE